MTKKNLTVKNLMKDYAISASTDDMQFTWRSFYNLYCLGYITDSAWLRFFNECSHWYYNEERKCVCTFENKTNNEIMLTPEYIESL